MFFHKKVNHTVEIDKYIKLLKESENDEEIFKQINNLIKYYENVELDPVQLKQNGFLRTIFYLNKWDLDYYILERKNATPERIVEIDILIQSYDLFLKELLELIKNEESALIRKSRMASLEKILTEEELSEIRNNYLNHKDETQKR